MERAARYSKKREAILEAVRSTHLHPTAEWVYQQLKPVHPELSLGTVYRNLNLFRAQGIIRCVGVVNGQERFDAETRPHSHFICDRCGAILDLEVGVDEKLEAEVGEAYGLRVDRHELVFHGSCGKCQEDKAGR